MDGQALDQLSTLPNPGLDLCRIRPCAAGCSPGELVRDSRDRQKQNGLRPAMCMELLLA